MYWSVAYCGTAISTIGGAECHTLSLAKQIFPMSVVGLQQFADGNHDVEPTLARCRANIGPIGPELVRSVGKVNVGIRLKIGDTIVQTLSRISNKLLPMWGV